MKARQTSKSVTSEKGIGRKRILLRRQRSENTPKKEKINKKCGSTMTSKHMCKLWLGVHRSHRTQHKSNNT